MRTSKLLRHHPASTADEVDRQRIVDGKVLRLIEQYIKAGVLEQMKAGSRANKALPRAVIVRYWPTSTVRSTTARGREREMVR
jgi:hypothetical protein